MASRNRDTPWRQGHLLPEAAVASLVESDALSGRALAVVASHDCDLANTEENEPVVEVILGRQVEALDGNCTNGKSIRKLHIQFDGSQPVKAEFSATSRRAIPKKGLAEYSPDTSHSLSPQAKNTFQCWLAARYRRSSFPDAFNKGLSDRGLQTAISKAVKPAGDHILQVLFDLGEPEEGGNVYCLGITLLYKSEPDPHEGHRAADDARSAIEAAFARDPGCGGCGIELEYVDIASDNALTYQQYAVLRPWRLDHISLASEPQQPTEPE